MTAIAGLVHQGRVYIGGDSAGVGDTSLTIRADKKVFRNGLFLFGFTTSFRMGQLLQYSFTPPDHDPRVDTDKFMVCNFVDSVRDCLKAGGFAGKHDEAEFGGTFLVGYKGRLFRIDGDYQVGEALDGFDAVGCGEDLVRGALFATQDRDPKYRIKLALGAAERMSAGVRGPFTIESI